MAAIAAVILHRLDGRILVQGRVSHGVDEVRQHIDRRQQAMGKRSRVRRGSGGATSQSSQDGESKQRFAHDGTFNCKWDQQNTPSVVKESGQ